MSAEISSEISTEVAAVVAEPETTSTPTDPADLGPATFGRVIRDQRKTIGVAFVLAVAAYWILGQLGEWTLAGCTVAPGFDFATFEMAPKDWTPGA